MSSKPFTASNLADDTSCSLEIWLEPSRPVNEKKTILVFDSPTHPGTPFSLQQNGNTLSVRRHNVDQLGTDRTAGFEVDGALHEKKRVFATITLGPHDTSIYLDGVTAMVFPFSGSSTNNFTGKLVIANSLAASDSWSGQILGLAIYDRQLTPTQIVKHYESWTKTQRPELAQEEAPVALYLFNERKGSIVHSQVDSASDLFIPARYFILHKEFLSLPWLEYRPTWSYWQSVGVNIAGFIPFGCCVFAYLSSVRAITRPLAVTILLGFATSLMIEILQAFLPTRDSGMTDVLTNTLGTALGVMLYRWFLTQSLLSRPTALPQ